MKDYKKLNLPLLTEKDEEYQMLLAVAEEYTRQHTQKTREKRSGDATEIVLREFLLKKGFNVTLRPDLKIQGQGGTIDRIDSLLLMPKVDPNKPSYVPEEVDAILEIKNNGVANQSLRIREKFDGSRGVSQNFRFAVAVFSERFLSRTPYKYAITEDELGNEKYRVFTFVARRIWDRMYDVSVVERMLRDHELWKTGEKDDLLSFLARVSA